LFKKNKETDDEKMIIEFWTVQKGLTYISDALPYRMSKKYPDWWKEVKMEYMSVKTCPSFPDVFSSAYVVPMWCDTEITYHEDGVYWKTPLEDFSWDFHSDDQFRKYTPKNFQEKVVAVMKTNCPWRIKTPKGYSVYQMPATYYFNPLFTVAPGIIHTDMYNEINQQVFLTPPNGYGTYTIKRGTPLAVYFPFKRDTFEIDVREASDEDLMLTNISLMRAKSKFSGGYRSAFKEINYEQKNN
jgi:hypothetical protein